MVRAALVSMMFSAAVAAESDKRPVLPFLEDDYSGAMVSAKATGLPIFVEVWAPW
jgi:hypothetical protein